MISLPNPPSVLGFPEKDMPVVEYKVGETVKKAKWTGRIHGNGNLELFLGYAFGGWGLSSETSHESIISITN
jgi:hypothetical protein